MDKVRIGSRPGTRLTWIAIGGVTAFYIDCIGCFHSFSGALSPLDRNTKFAPSRAIKVRNIPW